MRFSVIALWKKGVMPMDTMEVLTLLLVLFTALFYLDNRELSPS